GNSLKFDAIAFDPFGNIVPSDGVTWEVSDSDIGIINDCGVFTALRAGTVTVCAAGDGATGTSTVIVTCSEPIYARITVAPPAITLHTGGEETLIATVFDQYGGEMPGAEVTWESSDEAVGTIDADGRFIALAEGTTSITASVEGISDTATITVTGTPPVLFDTVMISPPAITLDAGRARRFIAAAFDPEGSIVDDAVAIWSCNDETIGTIDADGLFMAGAAGKATLTASVEGISGSGTAEVTVRPVDPAAPARIAVNPPDFFIAAGQSLTLAARVFDQYGSEMPGAEVTWESSDPAIGTIGDCGHFAAKSDGEVILIASADEISGSACVTVEPSIAVPDCIEVEPSTATVAVGETREFTATVLDQCGSEMNWVRVIWSCSDAGIGTIDMAGLFTALTEGSADVVARAGGIEGTASVTVTAGTAVDPTPGNDGGGGHGWGDSGGDAGPAFSTGICEGLVYGETYTFSDIDVSPVSSVAVTAAETIPRLMVTVKGVACPTATEPPSGDVYEYIDICLYWVNPRCISSALVIFTVPVDWIEDHGVLPEDIILMRCVDGTWQPLQTGFVGEESGSYCFRAITPGFSTFAIAAAAPESEAATGEGENVTAGEEANITVSVTTVVTTETATLPATTTPATPLVYAPLLAPIFLFFWWRKRA
ncbi:MAG: PGF-pre-PGF domain-containing protein, partial [Methanomicrobiales archaeon]|nr:PGF-pre-PGF domain-containing protein [Methanomicrobiales archaeon]